ncbi:MAG: CGNR zinc finger domain-containing protein [Candidatus Limnocylindrales bacterium]|nr:CGNR zinc finger domain-containing protein [Candidatus Limnocylindrales bacterium]
MFANALSDVNLGHAHGVDLEAAFDFLNTADTENGFPVEKLPSLDDVLAWFVDRGVIHREGADRARARVATQPASAAKDLDRVHAVRDALREVAEAIAERRAPRASALNTVNRALHARQVIELVPAPDGVNVDHRHVGDPIDDALARLADPLVTELTAGHPQRIRVCASDTCQWIFYDASRTSRRRWCDMSTCGNRAKAARHRARARGEAKSDDAASDAPAN